MVTLFAILRIGENVSELPATTVFEFDTVIVPEPVKEPEPVTTVPLPLQVELFVPKATIPFTETLPFSVRVPLVMVREVPTPTSRPPLSVILADEVDAPLPVNCIAVGTQLVVAVNFPFPLVLNKLITVKIPEALLKVPPF